MLGAPDSEQREMPGLGAEHMGAARHQGCAHIQKRQVLALVSEAPSDPNCFTLSVHTCPRLTGFLICLIAPYFLPVTVSLTSLFEGVCVWKDVCVTMGACLTSVFVYKMDVCGSIAGNSMHAV